MNKISLIALFSIIYLNGFTQNRIKFENTESIGSFAYIVGLVAVKPGENWEGNYLPRESSIGFLESTSNGICIAEKFHIGIGLGYASIKSTNGLLVSGDIRADFSKRPFSMFAYISPGYSHFWNQYNGGTGTAMIDLGFGTRHKIFDRNNALRSLGLLLMQMNTYISVKLGFSF